MPDRNDPHNDFGFGAVVARESEQRLLNRDGTFNVVREGLHPLTSLSLYHSLLTLSWPRYLLLVAAAYVVVNALFGGVFFALGPDALAGDDAATAVQRYLLDFFFSIHTFATIGYGSIYPVSAAAHWLVALESVFGLLGVALMTGLMFARFSRPIARIVFSDRAVIAPYPTGRAFMFRVVNGRSNQLIDLRAKVSLSWDRPDGTGTRLFHELALERDGVTLFPLSWTVVHPIGPDSPLYGVSEDELRLRDAEFFVVLSGMDESFAQQVHARTSYKPDEIAWGHRFSDAFVRREGRPFGVHVPRIHAIEPAALPDHAQGTGG
jgi:inward rectifier potassium channel